MNRNIRNGNGNTNKRVTKIDRLVGERVRQARLAALMSQAELGNACGVTFQQIQKNENGINRISSGRLVQIAKAVKQPISFFYDGVNEQAEEAPNPVAILGSTRQGVALARAFLRVADVDLRMAIVGMVEAISVRPDFVAGRRGHPKMRLDGAASVSTGL